MSAPAVPNLGPSVLEQYKTMMKTNLYQEVEAIQKDADKLTDRLDSAGKRVFEKYASKMIQQFKNENLEILKPDLKIAIEKDIQSGREGLVQKAKVIATVVLLVVGGIAATILAMEALVVASVIAVFVVSIFKLIGLLMIYGPGVLLIGGVVGGGTFAPAFFGAAVALTFSAQGGILAAVSAVAAGIGIGIGRPLQKQLDEEPEKELTKKINAYNKQVLEVTKKALKGDPDWEKEFQTLIKAKVFTKQNFEDIKELMNSRPASSESE